MENKLKMSISRPLPIQAINPSQKLAIPQRVRKWVQVAILKLVGSYIIPTMPPLDLTKN